MLLVHLISLVGCHLSSQVQRQWNTGRGNFDGEEKDWSSGKNKPRVVAENAKKS